MRRSHVPHIFAFIAFLWTACFVATPCAHAEITPSFPHQTVLSTNQPFGSAIVVADFDGDGRPDVAAASLYDSQIAWYRNKGNGIFSPPIVISTTASGPWSLAAADIDGDGRIDLVSGSLFDIKIAWYRNLGGSPGVLFGSPANNQRIIHEDSSDLSIFTSVAVSDLNGDGLPDVVAAMQAENKVVWYRNHGGGDFHWSAANPAANQKVISTAGNSPSGVAAGDLDGDGIADLAVTSFNDHTLAWFKGAIGATGGVSFTRHVISTNQLGAYAVTIADLNHDQRPDLICAAPHRFAITYFRNLTGTPGAAEPFFGPEQIVSDQARAVESIAAADLNRDGNPDIVSALLDENKIVWNSGSAPDENGGITFGPQLLISGEVSGPAAVAAVDFNGDGIADVASLSQNDSKVAVYFNNIQFSPDETLAPTLIAPSSGTATTNLVAISYTLPEDALAGSVKVSFTSGAVLRQFVLASGGGTAGSHVFSFAPAKPTASSEIASGSSSLENGTYDVTLSYQDAAGNPAAISQPASGVVIEVPAPPQPPDPGTTPPDPGTTPPVVVPDPVVPAPTEVSTSILVKKGDPVPGAGETGSDVPADAIFRAFGVPSLNAAGHLAVTASYTSGVGVRPVILGPARDGRTAVLAGAGDTIPNATGAPASHQQFESFKDVLLDDADTIAFIATVSGDAAARKSVSAKNDRGIWTNGGDGQLRLVAREGEAAPGVAAKFEAFTSVALSPAFSPEKTQVAFVARLRGAGVLPSNDEGLWIHRSSSAADGALKLLLRKGQKIALRGGASKRIQSFIALAANGGTAGHGHGAVPAGIAARVHFSDGAQALVRIAADGGIDAIAMTGDTTSDAGAALVKFGLPAQNIGGDVLAKVLLDRKKKISALLFAPAAGDASILVREADAAPGLDGATFAGFKSGIINADRNAAFIASAGDAGGIWFASPSAAPVLIAREGAQPPDIATGAQWKTFRSLALADGAHGPVFLADLAIPRAGKRNPAGINAANDTGVWAVDSKGALRLVVREGDTLAGTTSPIRALTLLGNVGGSPAQTRSYNARAEIIYRATLSDGSEVIAKAQLP